MLSPSYLFLFQFIWATQGYKITSETRFDHFPQTIPNYEDLSTFYKLTTNQTEIEKISCPEGFVFSLQNLHCVSNQIRSEGTVECLDQGLETGNWPNPDSCYTYYGCNGQCCYKMMCDSYLVFDPNQLTCLYPSDVQCCEYPEVNSNRLIYII